MASLWASQRAPPRAQTPVASRDPFEKKQLVILGGAYGGISVAHYLLKYVVPQLPDPAAYQVVVVSPSATVLCRLACPRALLSDDLLPQHKLFYDFQKAFEKYPENSFRFIHGSAFKVDHVRRSVAIHGSRSDLKLNFHALIIATGARTPSPLLGIQTDEDELRASWAAFREKLPNAKTIVIAGGGPTSIEVAGELGDHLNGRQNRSGEVATRPKASIIVVTAGKQILPYLRPAIAQKAESYLKDLGVAVTKGVRVEGISPPEAGTTDVASPATLSLSNEEVIKADLYIHATGTTPNTDFMDLSLLTKDGRIRTNESTLRVDDAGPRIYTIGDAGSYGRPAVHLIFNAVPIVCANIKRDLLLAAGVDETSVSKERYYQEDVRKTQLVPIGKSKGVGAFNGFQLPSWLVWAIKGRDYWLWTVGRLWSGKQWDPWYTL